MREAFDKYDTEKDGVISFDEFKLALAKFNYTDEELNDIFSRMVRKLTRVMIILQLIMLSRWLLLSFHVGCEL